MTSSTTPRDRAVEIGSVALNGGNPKLAIERWGDEVRTVVRALADAGLLSSAPLQEDGGEVSSLRSEPAAVGQVELEKLAAALYAADCREHNTDEGLSDKELWDSSSYTTGERDGHYRLMARAAIGAIGEAAREKA